MQSVIGQFFPQYIGSFLCKEGEEIDKSYLTGYS